MKKILTIFLIMSILVMAVFALTGCENKDEANNNNTVQSDGKAWPDLNKYNIPDFTAGKITDIVNNSDDFEYILKYEITAESVKKSDIDDYAKKFNDWTVTDTEDAKYIIRSDGVYKYSVVIKLDDSKNTARFVISAIE